MITELTKWLNKKNSISSRQKCKPLTKYVIPNLNFLPFWDNILSPGL